jgi:hypothetical protein
MNSGEYDDSIYQYTIDLMVIDTALEWLNEVPSYE